MNKPARVYETELEQWKRELSAELGQDVTYEQIAEETELSYSTLMKHARAQFRRPDYATAARICEFFNRRSKQQRTPLEYFVEVEPGQRVELAAV